MHGLPKGFDGSFFIGLRLDSVTFAEYVISLFFDGNVGITIDGTFAHVVDDGQEIVFQKAPFLQSSVMQLVGKSVVGVSSEVDGTLKLFFSNGHKFICYDSSKQYESYHIRNGDQEINV